MEKEELLQACIHIMNKFFKPYDTSKLPQFIKKDKSNEFALMMIDSFLKQLYLKKMHFFGSWAYEFELC